jgi:hypothetical protein
MRSLALAVLSLTTTALAACASSAPASRCASNAPCASRAGVTAVDATEGAPAIAKVWMSRCGSCHLRVEPGARDRATLTAALSRHRSRVKMEELQWDSLVDFLAADAK